MRIVDIGRAGSIASPIANAYIDFSKMTCSVVAVITDVIRDGKPVIGYGFNFVRALSPGERSCVTAFWIESPRPTPTRSLITPATTWTRFCYLGHPDEKRKPGGHGERSVAVGTIDMAIGMQSPKIAGQTALPAACRALSKRPSRR